MGQRFGGSVGAALSGLEAIRDTTGTAVERQERENIRAEKKRKEDERKKRLEAITQEVGDLTVAAQDPSFGQKEFAKGAQKIIEGSIELENPNILRSLDPIQQIIVNRQRQDIAQAKKKPKTAEEKLDLTPGQKELDKKFAKEFSEFVAAGGAADAEKNLEQLKAVRSALSTTDEQGNVTFRDDISGPIIGNVPDFALAGANPEALSFREQVEEVVQRNLRTILGAQFTEKEGERLIRRAFNPRLSEEENARRLDRMIKQMERALQAKKEASEFFVKNKGSLKGFEGPIINSVDDIEALEVEGEDVTVPLGEEETDLTSTPPKDQQAQVISPEQFQTMVQNNQERFQGLIEQLNQQRAAQGKLPVNEAEKPAIIQRILKSKGIIVQGGQ